MHIHASSRSVHWFLQMTAIHFSRAGDEAADCPRPLCRGKPFLRMPVMRESDLALAATLSAKWCPGCLASLPIEDAEEVHAVTRDHCSAEAARSAENGE